MKNGKLKGFPKEDIIDSMTIIKRIVWRPNNYRRGLEIRRVPDLNNSGFKSSIRSVPPISKFPVEVSFGGRNKLAFLKMSPNMKVMVGRSKIIGIWSQSKIGGHKETFLFEDRDVEGLDVRLREKKDEIRKEIDGAIVHVGRSLGVLLPGKRFFWVRHEDFLKGEEFIDSLPRECIIHDTVFKKVYGEGVEFIGGKGDEPTVGYKNYIKNRALEDFSPVIHAELCVLRESNLAFAENLKLHLVVLNRIGDGIDRLVKVVERLNIRQKRLSEY